MDDNTTVVNSMSIGDTSEDVPRSSSKATLHKPVFFLITTQGLLLQIKSSGIRSLFDTDYATVLAFIVALLVYIGILAAVKILQAHISSDSDEFVNKISLLSGTLASILLLLILVPALGWFALVCWTVWTVTVVIESYQYLKVLYTTTIGVVDRAFQKFKVLMSRSSNEAAPDLEQQNGSP